MRSRWPMPGSSWLVLRKVSFVMFMTFSMSSERLSGDSVAVDKEFVYGGGRWCRRVPGIVEPALPWLGVWRP